MTKITTDFEGVEPRAVVRSRLIEIAGWWGYAPGSWGAARAALNELLTGTSLGTIAATEFEGDFLPKLNLCNDPDGLILGLLFGAAEQGIFAPIAPDNVFTDTAGTTLAAPGDPVARVDDRSGNGNHATQATAEARPVYGIEPVGGRRNLLTRTEEFDNAVWSKAAGGTGSVPVITSNAATAPDGAETASRVQLDLNGGTASSDISWLFHATLSGTEGVVSNRSLYLKSFDGSSYDLIFGTSTGLVVLTKITVTSEWQRFDISHTADANTNLLFGLRNAGGVTGVSDTADLLVWGAQLELGSTATAYQRVGSEFDVTEAGKRSLHYLFDDDVDDSLPATLPDLGTDATIFFATDAGVTISGSQTIGAGAFETLRGQKTFAVGAINRALTAAENARLQLWLEREAGL